MGSACCRSEEKATPTEKNLKKITEHVTFDKFIKAFDEHAARGDKFVVYLTAAIDGRDMQTNQPKTWSKYCNAAAPYIAKHLERNKSRPVLKGLIMSREEWVGVDTHPYKTHPVLRAQFVPCMMLFHGKKEVIRIRGSEDVKDDEYMAKLFD